MTISQVAIVGAGLIGGSLALSARRVGWARRVVALEQALPPREVQSIAEEAFDAWAVQEEHQRRLLSESELIVLCVPVRTITLMLPRFLEQTSGTVTDCGSTKREIVQVVTGHPSRSRFVPGHPMAGHPRGGLAHASADLFEGRRWILCAEGSDESARQLVEEMVHGAGSEVVPLSAEEHDSAVAATSHVPQIIASALSVMAHESNAMRAAGPGFASSTRVAGGAEAMWRDIFSSNHDAIGSALRRAAQQLEGLGRKLEAGSVEEALALLEQARGLRDKA